MYLLSNKKTRDEYRHGERKVKWCVFGVLVASVGLTVAFIVDYNVNYYQIVSLPHFLVIWGTKNAILCLMIVCTGMNLLRVLKRQYNYEY
jgi:hypothetical protein